MSQLEENTNNTDNTQNKMNPMLIVGVIIAVLVVGAVVVLGQGGLSPADNTETESTMGNENETVSGDEPMEADEAMMAENIIEVEGGSFYFKPNVIRAKAGEPITVKLTSVDMMHDFVVDELDARTPIVQKGNTGTVTFTPTEPGEYEFYCSVGNHRAQGMTGTLIVE